VRRVRHNDEGFVLVAAIWLLILCGGIAAILMLRGIERGREAKNEGDILKSKLELESAVETVIADILFSGPRSRWIMVPASGTVSIGSDDVAVHVSSESGRLDLNDGDLDRTDLLLRTAGFTAQERQPFMDALNARRKQMRKLASWPEVDQLLAKLPHDRMVTSCIAREFTLYSGLHAPRASQASPELARALSLTGEGQPLPLEPGTALRIETKVPAGASLLAVVRITGMQSRPYSVLRWQLNAACGTP